MNKDTEIKAVKDKMRELADKLEALEAPVVRTPQAGEIWIHPNGTEGAAVVVGEGGFTHLDGGYSTSTLRPESLIGRGFEYIGKSHGEVYMLRSEAPEFDDLRQKLLSWRDCDGDRIIDGSCFNHEAMDYLEELLADTSAHSH